MQKAQVGAIRLHKTDINPVMLTPSQCSCLKQEA